MRQAGWFSHVLNNASRECSWLRDLVMRPLLARVATSPGGARVPRQVEERDEQYRCGLHGRESSIVINFDGVETEGAGMLTWMCMQQKRVRCLDSTFKRVFQHGL